MEFDQSLKTKKPKCREVSSRFLSPSSNLSSSNNQINPMPSPNQILSPLKQKPRSSGKHKGPEKSGFMAKLWPSSVTSSQSSSIKLKDLVEQQKHGEDVSNNFPVFLTRQRSCLEFSRFDGDKDKEGAKENHRPLIGGSMRFPVRSSTSPSSSSSSSSKSSNLLEDYSLLGRFSVDEISLGVNNFRKRSDFFPDLRDYSESEDSEVLSNNSFTSPAVGKNNTPSYMAPTLSSRNSGIEVSSKYLQDSPSKSRRWSADSGAHHTKGVSTENSPKKTPIKRSTSLRQIPATPRKSNSAMAEKKGKVAGSKQPTSPSKVKGVGSFFSMGLELLKVKKPSSNTSSPSSMAAENIHRMRMMHNRLLQWRYVNAKSDGVNGNISRQVKSNLICAWDGLAKLHHSVIQKKLQLQKEKMEMKLTSILHSQIKQLEAWGDMETQHLQSISMTKDSLNSVVCSVPLVQGAKVDPESTSIALQDASDLAASMELMLSPLSPGANKTAEVMKEIAEVVVQEKLLLEECLELFKTISRLEIEERSLKCNIIQLRLQQGIAAQ